MSSGPRKDIRVRRTTLAETERDGDFASLPPGRRVELVWQLTREAWGIKDGDEPRLRRDVVRVIRRGR
ncbi:MAG: hypothetical protein LC732_09455 [Acidobacteria bacterium]|nr:hypothetical protein [Acidobacteriota bacterium]